MKNYLIGLLLFVVWCCLLWLMTAYVANDYAFIFSLQEARFMFIFFGPFAGTCVCFSRILPVDGDDADDD